MCRTGAGVHRNTTSFRRKISACFRVLAFVLARGGRNERGGLFLFSGEVHATHAVSAFQTKLSTASSVNLQLICVQVVLLVVCDMV